MEDMEDIYSSTVTVTRGAGSHETKAASKKKPERTVMGMAWQSIKTKIKIIWTFSQLISGLSFVLDVQFPDPYSSVAAALGNLNLSFFQLAPVECTFPDSNFFTDLVFSTSWPILVAAVLLSLHWRNRAKTQTYFSSFLVLTYLILPGASSKIFSTFKYDEFIIDDETTWHFVSVDYSIEKGTLEANVLIIYAIIMIFVYVIGIPTLYVVLLYRAQNELSPHKPIKLDPAKLVCSAKERAELKVALTEFYFGNVTLGYGIPDKTFEMLESTDKTKEFIGWLEQSEIPHPATATLLPLLKAYYTSQGEKWEVTSKGHLLSFLLGSWEQRVYWWEVFEVVRRLLLSGVLLLFGPGSAIQSAMSILICLFSIKAYSLYSPFREDEDDFLQEVTQWQLFMVLFSTILARVDASGDSSSDQMILGWLLIAFVVPGYVTMAWQCVKSYSDVFSDTYNEAKKAKGEAKELGAACGGCLGLNGGGGAAAAGQKAKRPHGRRSSQAQLNEMLVSNIIELKPLAATEATRELFDASSVQAMYEEGLAYHYGRGVPENLERARECYMQSCGPHHLEALNNLAAMCLRGEGGPRDYPLALELWEAGAKKGDSESIFSCGLLYRYGYGVEQDERRARSLFERAQSLGFEAAATELAKMDLLVEEDESVTTVVSGAFSGGAAAASESFQYVAGAFTLSEEEGLVELAEVSLVCNDLDGRETSLPPESQL